MPQVTSWLDQLILGAVNPKGTMADFRHASRTFVDDTFRLAPKHKFLFHVAFVINPNALKTLSLKYQSQYEINLLVKSVSLPSFNVTVEKVNQYNRIKLIQTKQAFPPITLKFHDDNNGIVNRLWQNYYSYYYATPMVAKVAGSYYRDNSIRPDVKYRYGLDNDSSAPFFGKIVIYQMSRQEYTAYTLINPMISSFNFDQSVSRDAQGPAEATMQLDYEAIYFDEGLVKYGDPIGFGLEHYDRVPSPLSITGGGTRTVLGPGGVLSGIAGVLDNISSGRAFETPIGFLSTTIAAINTYKNARELSKAGVAAEAKQLLLKALGSSAILASDEAIRQRLNGLTDIVVPVTTPPGTKTTATPVNLGGGGP